MPEEILSLTSNRTSLRLAARGQRLALQGWALAEKDWLGGAPCPLFQAWIGGQPYDATNLKLAEVTLQSTGGAQRLTATLEGGGFRVEYHLNLYEDTALIEFWQVLRNEGEADLAVTRFDSFAIPLRPGQDELLYYTGDWGSEFEPVQAKLTQAVRLESRSGRSSKGQHPWFALFRSGQGVLSGAVAWSGNWVMRLEPAADGSLHLSGGLSDWEFSKALHPGQTMESPHGVLALGRDLNDISQQYAAVGRKHWYPRNALSASQPVEWNHWWSYEDVEIDEEVFLRNVETAARMGIEVCTLDAGWFGPSEKDSHWYEVRGDWQLVNTDRFPSGIRRLADAVHAHGMKFGIWCEIEGLGVNAQLARAHPEYVALRDGERIGYVCFGNPAVQEWAYQTLRRLIEEFKADWIKLDFNLDPGAGCNRSDHGHGSGDGLYEHYRGYYHTLQRVRRDFPEVVLENCSSGGLRIDLGMLRHTDMTFLSDPDWPVHDLQIFWGASTMLAPDTLLHWSFCDWRSENPPPQQTFDPHDPNLTQAQLDYYTRISMLGLYGFSQKLPDLPAWVTQRLNFHTSLYQERVRRFVREADLYRLTGQPRRDGSGERWSAFQYSLPADDEHLLFVFRLPGAEHERAIRLEGLQPNKLYVAKGFEGEFQQESLGSDLMKRGILFNDLPEEGSALLRIA